MAPKTERLGYIAENDNSTMAYHRDYPMGKEIDLNRTDLREIAKQGWVRHPGYLGIGVEEFGWSEETVAQLKAQFESGEVEAFNYEKYTMAARERQAKEALTREQTDEMTRAQRVKDAPSIIEEAQTAEERENDEISDAMKVRRKDKGLPHNLSGAVRQQERAKELDTAPAGQEETEAFATRRNTLIESAAAMGVTLSDVMELAPDMDIDSLTAEDYANIMDKVEKFVQQPPAPKRRSRKAA